MKEEPKHPVRTVEKAFEIVDVLRRIERAGVTEIAEETGYGVSLVHNHLNTLRMLGYVNKAGQKYELGLGFLEVGGEWRDRLDLFRFGAEEVKALAEDTDELVNMVVEERGTGIEVFRERGEQGIENNTTVGRRINLHSTASGKAILSQLPERRVEEIVDRIGLPTKTPNTITDRDAMFEDLRAIRERGYAIDDEEQMAGLRCIGAPVTDGDGELLGAISVSAPTSRMRDERFERTIPDRVLGAVNVVEVRISHETND